MIVLFLGPDCSGKDSLMHELAKLYDYKYYMSPRSPICNIVYDTIYNRTETSRKETNFKLIEKFLDLGACFVYIKVDSKVLLGRALARNEKHVSSLQTFKQHIKIYEQIVQECKKKFKDYSDRFIQINNSSSIETVAQKLKEKVDPVLDMITLEDASEHFSNR